MNNLDRAIYEIQQEVEALPASDQQTKCAMLLSALRERVAKARRIYRVGDEGELANGTEVYCLTESGARMASVYGPGRYRAVTPMLAVPTEPDAPEPGEREEAARTCEELAASFFTPSGGPYYPEAERDAEHLRLAASALRQRGEVTEEMVRAADERAFYTASSAERAFYTASSAERFKAMAAYLSAAIRGEE